MIDADNFLWVLATIYYIYLFGILSFFEISLFNCQRGNSKAQLAGTSNSADAVFKSQRKEKERKHEDSRACVPLRGAVSSYHNPRS